MKRLLLALGLIVAASLGFESCQNIGNQNINNNDKDLNAVVAGVSVNDMHSAIDMMPQFAAMLDSLRGIYPDLLVFSAGDNRTGNPVNDQYEPVNYPMIALMNKVGFDLCAVGNHEWDGGVQALQKNIEDADFPFLCANVVVPENIKLDVKPYEILHVQGLDIAVVGLVETRASGIPGAHPMHFTEISFKKGIDVLPEYQYLRDEADIFIAAHPERHFNLVWNSEKATPKSPKSCDTSRPISLYAFRSALHADTAAISQTAETTPPAGTIASG